MDYLASFECPINPEIEHFVARNAIDFARKNISVTYLVINSLNEIAGLFTLTHKPSFINPQLLASNTLKRKLERFCGRVRVDDKFLSSAFLIAQFSKNLRRLQGLPLSGNELMKCAFEVLLDIQRKIGGGVIFVECERQKKLLDFYQNEHNRFVVFGERADHAAGKEYVQLLKVI